MEVLLNPRDIRSYKPTVYTIEDTPVNRKYIEDCIDSDEYTRLRKYLDANNTNKRQIDYWLKEW